MKAILLALLPYAGLDARIVLVRGYDCPGLACTFPADALLLGPAGSIGIGYRIGVEGLPVRRQERIVAHELCHASLHMDQLRRGEKASEDVAEACGRELLKRYREGK